MSIKQNIQAQIIMKQIDKSTSKVVKDNSETMYINSTNNVWFNISFNNNEDYWYSGIYLKIKVFQTTAEKVTLRESTDLYLNMSEDYPVYQLKEGNDTYLYIDLTYALMNSKGEATYFSLMTTSGSVGVYTNKATLVNQPSLDLLYIKENEYHKKQENISGSSNESDQYSVNIRNKRLKYSINLFEEKNSINPLMLDLQYSQDDVNEPGLKGKWRFNYYQTIRSIDGNKYIYTDANNDKHTFVPVENAAVGEEYKIYYDQGGTYLIMKIDRTGTQGYFFEITDEKRIRLLFNSQGNLIKRIIKIKSDKELVNEVTYDSNGKITNIKSSHGYQVGITYSSTEVKLINSLNEESTITIDSSSVTKINNKGQESKYFYDSTKKLNKITSRNNQIDFSYQSGISKISKIKESYISDNKVTRVIELSQVKMASEVIVHQYSETANDRSLYYIFRFNKEGELIKSSETTNSKLEISQTTYYDNKISCEAYTDDQDPVYVDETVRQLTNHSSLSIDLDLQNDFNPANYLEISYEVLVKTIIDVSVLSNIKLQVKEDEEIIKEELLDINNGEKGTLIIPYEYKLKFDNLGNAEYQNFTLVLICGSGISLKITKLKVYKRRQSETTRLSNIQNGTSKYTLKDINFYLLNDLDIQYTSRGNQNITKQDIEVGIEDIYHNQDNYIIATKNSQTNYGIWYNNGKNYIYQAKNVKYKQSSYEKGINDFKVILRKGNEECASYVLEDYYNNNKRRYSENKYQKKDESKSFIDYQEVISDEYDNLIEKNDDRGIKVAVTRLSDNLVKYLKTCNNSWANSISSDNNIEEYEKYDSLYDRVIEKYGMYNNQKRGSKYQYDAGGNLIKTRDINDNGGTSYLYQEKIYEAKDSNLLSEVNYKFNESNISRYRKSFTYDNSLTNKIYDANTEMVDFTYNTKDQVTGIKILEGSTETVNGSTVIVDQISCTYDNQESNTTSYRSSHVDSQNYDKYQRVIKREVTIGGTVEYSIDYAYKQKEINSQ